ncbi:glucuronate isomerase [Flagellimonas pacifica]|uniref:Uronate isomerase n=1 Tax=Flagellimonas pacifica TaxID=1247520 RepID=A0A285MX33_9FLAO|nr:glucuronate isomerase [Allomuricauda parva]SNZ00051.1 D-glucuronate isomerase [Allomuricauda parva]
MLKKLSFINDNFLLQNSFAEKLYHEYAKNLPIIDYHCHLSPKDIATNRVFNNITEAWIHGDHYKWRAMRTVGTPEDYITGDASDKEKFSAWAKTVPQTIRNPLYHWTHLELARYFELFDLLNENNAQAIYNSTSESLRSDDFSCRSLLSKMKVEVVCTTDDPLDSLEYHKKMTNEESDLFMGTSFRPDKAIHIGSESFNSYVNALAEVANLEINCYNDLCDALAKRIAYFNANGCTLSDHGLENIPFEMASHIQVSNIFIKKRSGKQLEDKEVKQFATAILLFLSETYNQYGWVQQFHLGPLRNNNSRMLKALGPDTGWDSIGDFSQARNLSRFLDALDSKNKLTKTILYNSNPADNEVFAAMVGNFNDGSIKGKVQYGSGWWFLDQKDGITMQLNALSNIGLISCFVGMLTDSRSFLSFPRHEYFRRVLCNLFGEEIQKGELPNDTELIGKMIRDICYFNAKEYFDFKN